MIARAIKLPAEKSADKRLMQDTTEGPPMAKKMLDVFAFNLLILRN